MVSEQFRGAWQIIPLLAFAYVFHGVYFFFINILFVKDTGLVFIVTLSAMIVDVVLNILLVPIWGFWGCGIACFMTYFSRSIFALILSRKKNKAIRYNVVAMLGVPFVFLALSFANWYMINLTFAWSLLAKMVLCFLLIVFFYLKYHSTIKILAAQFKSN